MFVAFGSGNFGGVLELLEVGSVRECLSVWSVLECLGVGVFWNVWQRLGAFWNVWECLGAFGCWSVFGCFGNVLGVFWSQLCPEN